MTKIVQREIPLWQQAYILGGGVIFTGFCFFIGGMFFCINILPALDCSFLYWGEWTKAKGTVLSIKETLHSEDDVRVMEVVYTFRTNEGKMIKDNSYFLQLNLKKGDTVAILYQRHYPNTSYIEGGRMNPVPFLFSFVIIFPIAGFTLLFYTLRSGLMRLRVFKYGVECTANFVEVLDMGKDNDGDEIFHVVYEYEVNGKMYKNYKLFVNYLRNDIQEAKTIFYDTENPQNAVFEDEFPTL